MAEGGDRTLSVWDAISSRRVVRRFADRPLDGAHLDRILQAGRRANSSKNQQRWAFIVCRERDHLRQLAEVGPWAGHLAGAAAAIALVTPDPSHASAPLSVMFDLGMAADEMILAAWELGIGSVPATVVTLVLLSRFDLKGVVAQHVITVTLGGVLLVTALFLIAGKSIRTRYVDRLNRLERHTARLFTVVLGLWVFWSPSLLLALVRLE